eukprot:ctg_1370.g530
MDECVARGDLASASQWLEAMLDGGDSGNDGYCSLALLNAMLHASIYQRGVAVALRLFGTMLRHGVVNRVTCNIAMQACRVAAMLKGAAAIKKYMERRDALLHPDEVTYGTLLGLYCERGMLEQCMELRAEMAERGVPMSAHAVHALIGCALHAGQVQAAWALYKEHVRPQLQTVVDGAAAAASTDDGDVDRNRATAATAAGNGSATASDGAAAVGNRGRRMQQRPFPAELFVNALRACSRLGLADEAERVFQEMQPYQCTPSSRAHNALLAAYVRADRFPEAFAAIRSLRQRQLTPHPRVLQTLAERLSEAACRGVERTSPAASDAAGQCVSGAELHAERANGHAAPIMDCAGVRLCGGGGPRACLCHVGAGAGRRPIGRRRVVRRSVERAEPDAQRPRDRRGGAPYAVAQGATQRRCLHALGGGFRTHRRSPRHAASVRRAGGEWRAAAQHRAAGDARVPGEPASIATAIEFGCGCAPLAGHVEAHGRFADRAAGE